MRSSFAPFRAPGYPRLVATYVVNQLGDSIAIVALAILVYDQSDSALATAGLFLSAKFLPAFIAPVLVAQLDQLRVNRVLTGLYAAEAVGFVGLAVLASHYVFAGVLIVALIDGVLALAARSLSRGAVAEILTPMGLLREGNALMNVGFGAAVVLGMVLGGIIVSGSSATAGLLVDAATFAAAAAIIAGLGPIATSSERQHFVDRLRAGVGHVRSHPSLPLLLVGQSLALVFFYLIIPIEVIYAKSSLGVGDAGFGILLGAWSAGILVGSLVYVRLSSAAPVRLVVGSTAAIGAAYLGLALANELWIACVISILGGVGNGFQWVSVMTLLQEATPTHLQARVVGFLESLGAAMPGLGFLLGGALTAIWSPRLAYAIAGIGVLAIATAGAVLLPSRLRPQPLPEAPSDGA